MPLIQTGYILMFITGLPQAEMCRELVPVFMNVQHASIYILDAHVPAILGLADCVQREPEYPLAVKR